MKKSTMEAVAFAPRRALTPRKHDISYLLGKAGNCRTLTERVAWLESLLAWVRSTGTPAPAIATAEAEASRTNTQAAVRIRFVLHLCERHPEWGVAVGEVLAQLASELPATELFCQVGMDSGRGLVGQVTSILIDRFLPVRGGAGDLDQLITSLFPTDADADWVEVLPPAQIQQILRLVEAKQGPRVWHALHASFADAMLIMVAQVTGSGMEQAMRRRAPHGSIATSSFFRLFEAVRLLQPRLAAGAWVSTADREDLQVLLEVIRECMTSTAKAFSYLEVHGVSVDLVFRFERVELLLKRLLQMGDFLVVAASRESEAGVGSLLAELIRASHDGHRLGRLFSGKIRLLSRRIVEHTGASGDHYIVHDRAGYFQMLLSAGGGGLLTVGTTICKAAIARFPLPPLMGLLANASNYAGSFLLMNLCHFTLATKQPSMTASTLARKLSGLARNTDSQEVVATIRDAFRSQFAAALGNVGVAIPTAAGVAWLYQRWFGGSIFTQAYAHKTLVSLDPVTTLTVPFAIFTGFMLWAASLLSGAIENSVALHQLPQRLEGSRYLQFWLGAARTTRLVGFFRRHLPGFAGSIVLGVLLALTPFLAALTGIPLDVRHVTLSSSALAISVVTLGQAADTEAIVRAASGVALTGAMNFGVSFFLALVVAARAQNVRRGLLGLVSRRVVRMFFRAPLAFFWPR